MYVAESDAAPVTGNSHVAVPSGPPPDHDAVKHTESTENHTASSGGGGESPKKEKSVLQAKLTKLAIQIGYAGYNL